MIFPAHAERKVCKLKALGYNGQQNKKSGNSCKSFINVYFIIGIRLYVKSGSKRSKEVAFAKSLKTVNFTDLWKQKTPE